MADKKCPHCGEPHAEAVKFCPTTGKAIEAPKAVARTMMMFAPGGALPGAPSPAKPAATVVGMPGAKLPGAAGSPGGGGGGGLPPSAFSNPGLARPPAEAASPRSAQPAAPVPSPVASPPRSAPAALPAPPVAARSVPASPNRPSGARPAAPPVPPPPVAPPPLAADPEPQAPPAAEGPKRKESIPDWAEASEARGAAASFEGTGEDAVVWLPVDAPAKGIGDLLKESVALYKKHAKVFLITAAILFIPGSLVSSLTLAALTAPLVGSTSQMERVAERMAKKQERLGGDFAERLAAGKVDAKEMEAAMKDIGENAAEATALAGVAVGGIMAALLGILSWVVLAFIMYSIVLPLTQGALTIAVTDRVLGGDAGWRQHWGLLFRRLGRLLSALIPAAILCAIGTLFFVIPGLVLSFFFVFVPLVVLIEGTGGTAALRRSFALVKSDWLRVLLVLIVFGVLNMVAHFAAALVVPASAVFLGRLLGDLLTLALLPIPILGIVLLYLDLRRKQEGQDPAQLRAELEALRA